MSNLYNLEPQPTAKVVLNTTSGDLTLELFAKQTPLASRNFLQHCLDGYYNNTIFHRLVQGFIVQGGDPTGTGHGGISAINEGEPFKDEFHSRLKFNRRGLLGMANEGKDNNASQFFLTLDATPELQGKHTMFGRIEGDTIYNLMKIGDAEMTDVEGSDRPLYPTKITGAEVLVNPFEEMVARAREAPRTKEDGKKEVKKRKKPLGKNVLSFGADEGEEEAAPVLKKVKANPKLVAVEPEKDSEANVRKSKARKQEKIGSPQKAATTSDVDLRKTESRMENAEEPEDNDEESESESDEKKRQTLLDKTNAEIAALKASMKRNVHDEPKEKEKPKTALEAMIPSSSTRGRKRGKAGDERGAMDLFKAFKSKLKDQPPEEAPAQANGETDEDTLANGDGSDPNATENGDEEAILCDLHFIANCQSCKSWNEENPDTKATAEDDDDLGWMSHTLTFAKDTLGKDLEWKKRMAEIEVIDPREKAKNIQEKNSLKKGKSKSKR